MAVPPTVLANAPPEACPDESEPEPQRPGDNTVQQALGSLDDLLGRLEAVPGPTADAGLDAVATLTEIYGEALARIIDQVAAGGEVTVAGLAGDELVGHLLVLHGLHPDPAEQRVNRALGEVRPHLAGGDVELAGIAGGVASIRITASGCSAAGLPAAVTDAVLAAAPELASVNVVTQAPPAATPLIPAEALLRRPGPSR
jgi:hypothetical protein